jgi:predicted anti-sigma-YlaC factor YlaD
MIILAVILLVIVFVGPQIWVSRYGPQITDEVLAAYSILAALGFIMMYLYWKPKYRSGIEPAKGK